MAEIYNRKYKEDKPVLAICYDFDKTLSPDDMQEHFVLNKAALRECGPRVKLFPGVEDWFERIREYGKGHQVIIEHYIISSGLKEMIEGTKMAQEGAKNILLRIEKGTLEVNDPGVNDYYSPERLRVPFRNMVYIGDSDTDIPCMKLVNTYGGHSIGVYNSDTEEKQSI